MDFNPELQERQVDTRARTQPAIIIFQIEEIKQHYDENMDLLRAQFPIAGHLLEEGNTSAAKTIWRTQIILLASAFDFFMHEVVWYGMKQMYDEDWGSTEQYTNLSIPIKALPEIRSNMDEWFDEFITDKYSQDTIVQYGDVRDHLNLVGIKPAEVARRAFYRRGATEKPIDQMKRKLNALYKRRNQIAHQSDRSARDGVQEDISRETVEKYMQDVNKIVDAVIEEMKQQ